MSALSLDDLRRCYAEELRATAPVLRNNAVVEAFATVPREKFLGEGPWRILPPKSMDTRYQTPDADPRWLYHDVLIAIDEQKGINNGEPALWARLLDHVDILPGDRLMQVGAGTGYYSAILAELAGPTGHVIAVEYQADLAARARDNLRAWRQVEVVRGDGTLHDPGPVDVIIAFAGATHPATTWLERLGEGGRLLMPLTGQSSWGFFLKAIRHGSAFRATSLGQCGFIHCIGGRDGEAARRLQDRLRALRGRPVPIQALHPGAPPPEAGRRVWYAGPNFWLSREDLPAAE